MGGGTDGYVVDWADLENLFKSKYTKDLTDRHSAAIIKICRQYMAHYGGIPYTDVPSLTPLVHHLVTGYQQGKSDYGLALRALCTTASKPFIARKMSDPITYKDKIVLFVVTLCQAAAYESVEPAATLRAGETEQQKPAVCELINPSDAVPTSATLAGDIRLEIVDFSDARNPRVEAKYPTQFVEALGTNSICSSTISFGALVKSEDACESSANIEKHTEVSACHTPSPTAAATSRNLEDDSPSLTPTPRTTAIGITAVENQSRYPPAIESDDGSPAGGIVNNSVQAQAPEGDGTPSGVTREGEQQKQQISSVLTSRPMGEPLLQTDQGGPDGVRIAVFDLLRALIGQWTTSLDVSIQSRTKEQKAVSSAAASRLAYWPFELPACITVLNLVKAAFSHSSTTPVVHSSIMGLLLDLSRHKPMASRFLDSRLFNSLLHAALFDAGAAAGFPSGAAYVSFRSTAIETLLNFAECTSKESSTVFEFMKDEEASELVNNLLSLLRQLHTPRSPYQIIHLRNDLLCIVLLLSRQGRLLPYFASSSLLQRIIDDTCNENSVLGAFDATPGASSNREANGVQLNAGEVSSSRSKRWEILCGADGVVTGRKTLAGEPLIPTQATAAAYQEAESLTLCWATIVNCLDDPSCRRVIQKSTSLQTLFDFLTTELNAKEATESTTNRAHHQCARRRVLFMQAFSLLSPALEHAAKEFIDFGGLSLLLRVLKEHLFPKLADSFLQLLTHICLISSAAERARAILLADHKGTAVETLICCMEGATGAHAALPGETPVTGLPAESRFDFLKSQHYAALLLAVVCYDKNQAREQFLALHGPRALAKQLKTTLELTLCVRSWTLIAYVFCLSECIWATVMPDSASVKEFLGAGGLAAILEALKRSPKLLQRHLLGCLTELLHDEEAVQVCRDWRSPATGESAMEVLILLWERDQKILGSTSQDGSIADIRRPLNSQEMAKGSPTRHSSLNQASAGPSDGVHDLYPGEIGAGVNNLVLATSCPSHDKCSNKAAEAGNEESTTRSLEQALLLAITSNKPEKAFSGAYNLLEQAVSSYEHQDMRLDVFCAIESLTRQFSEVTSSLTTEQKQQMELVKAYPNCCELEMWEDVRLNLKVNIEGIPDTRLYVVINVNDAAESVQPTDTDLHWMETEIAKLYSVSSNIRDMQQLVAQEASSAESKAADDFYNKILSKSARKKS